LLIDICTLACWAQTQPQNVPTTVAGTCSKQSLVGPQCEGLLPFLI
jgi:hypothetical protein